MTPTAMAALPELVGNAGRQSTGRRTAGPGISARLGMVFDPLRFVLFTLTIFNISRFHQMIGLEKLRPGLLLVLFAGAYGYLNAKSLTRVNVMQFWPMRRVALMCIAVAASMAFGLSIGGSGKFIFDSYAKTILYCVLITLAIRNVRDLYTFVWAAAISTGILSFFALFVIKLSKSAFSYTARAEGFITYDANDVCVVMLVGLSSVLLLLSVARGWQKGLLLVLVIGAGATIARSGSRGGFLGTLVFGVAALFLLDSVTPLRRIFIVLAVAGGMAMFAPPGYTKQLATILNPSEDYNTKTNNGRSPLIKRGLHYFAVYPIFGVGIDNFRKAECEPKLSGLHGGAGGTRCGAPHNSYIQALSETGAMGFMVYVSLVFGGVISMLLLKRRIPRRWMRGNPSERFMYAAPTFFAVGLVGFAASSFFVSFAWMDVLYMQIALIAGLYISITAYKASLAAASASGTQGAAAPARRGPGWRVRESAQRQLAVRPMLRLNAPR